MTIFITGSSGFVGKNLIEKLTGRYELLTPNHSELDLLDEQAVADFLKKHKKKEVFQSRLAGPQYLPQPINPTDNLP